MVPLLGLGVLLVLTVYISALTYVLRRYSRARLGQLISESHQRRWLLWLEQHDTELSLTTGFMRLALCAGILLVTETWYVETVRVADDFLDILPPILIALALIALMGVAIPHALAVVLGERYLASVLWTLPGLRLAAWPVSQPLLGVEYLIKRMLGKPAVEDAQAQSERIEQEILDAVQEGELQGAVDEDEREMIRSVFELRDTCVSEIMTPRTEMVAIDVNSTFDQVRRVMLDTGHSRIPAFEETLDKIVGVLYIKDLIALLPDKPFDARMLLRKVPFVPETKPIAELLEELRRQKVHIAIVLDEYSGTAGVVTIEDILEELVGEIADEYDRKPPPAIKRIDLHTLEVDARVHVHEVNNELEISLPEDDDYDTIGGFVSSAMGKIPAAGEEFTQDNVHFRVIDADARKITRLRLHVARQEQPA